MADERTPEPSESWALGALTGILMKEGIKLDGNVDVNSRSIDVAGLVPKDVKSLEMPIIRITVEEVR